MRRCRYRSMKVTLRSSFQECVCKALDKFALMQSWHCKCTIWYDTPERVASAPDHNKRWTPVCNVTNSSECFEISCTFLYFSYFLLYLCFYYHIICILTVTAVMAFKFVRFIFIVSYDQIIFYFVYYLLCMYCFMLLLFYFMTVLQIVIWLYSTCFITALDAYFLFYFLKSIIYQTFMKVKSLNGWFDVGALCNVM